MPPDPTPPHHPTHNIRLTRDEIQEIVRQVFPSHQSLKVEQLESGKSFNNRIYFLDVTTSSDSGPKLEQYVLKVAGQFFGARKIQNEVGCLQILAKYCPKIPTAKVVAWSDDGTRITTMDGRSLVLAKSFRSTDPAFQRNSWILTTRLPGRILDFEDLDNPSGAAIMKRLAAIIADWRTNLPRISQYGNLRYREDSESTTTATAVSNMCPNGPEFAIGGLILVGDYDGQPLRSAAEYYSYMARDQIRELTEKTESVLEPLAKQIEDPIREFVSNDLARLSFLRNRDETASFTHFDFSPRNILVSSDDPTTITGMLDCEFAGFAPWEEEFINMQVRQTKDWPRNHYQTLVQELEKLGQRIPPFTGATSDSTEPGQFGEACILADVIANIAPWYIFPDSMPEAELNAEMERAAAVVLDGIQKLKASSLL